MNHPAVPPLASRPWLAVATVTWLLGALLAPPPSPLPVEDGPYEGRVTLRSDVAEGRYGPWALGEIEEGTVLVDFGDRVDAGRGDELSVTGGIDPDPGIASGRAYGAVLTVRRVSNVEPSRFHLHRAGSLIMGTVEERLDPFDDGRALLAGFLIGETSRIQEPDVEAMRRSGLAHFVAVSGSNVALFLALLAVAAGPLALGPKRRALVGLIGLPVYVAATRFEPSVMRASVMAGIALGGRLVGVVLEAWQLLSVAVVVLVATDPGLTSNVGFQLSVAATAGVLVGARWPVEGRIARALVVTLGAQLAVAPLLLIHFGTVPLLSPVINLVAAPLVAAATVVGAVGVAGFGFLIGPASWLAGLVLSLARGAAPWPQLETWELLVLFAAVLAFKALRPIRPVISLGAAGLLLLALVSPRAGLPTAGVVVLDVGQGDAILIHGGGGDFALVDGGPDQTVLLDKLADYGVRSLELMVLTHVHADHAKGLTGTVGRIAIEEVWAATEPHSTAASRELFDALLAHRIPVVSPHVGTRRRLGVLELVVEGPVRRYASPNDQSIVLTVRGPRRTMLLSGDIETHAQADLSHLRADVLKVPHQGAGTSEENWLVEVGAGLAVISVGPNEFGHPVEWVTEVLEERGELLRTDTNGDVLVDLTS
ncbi:MAG: ComEC/Rec2 family competence protein [Actinomycetota bacterium]